MEAGFTIASLKKFFGHRSLPEASETLLQLSWLVGRSLGKLGGCPVCCGSCGERRKSKPPKAKSAGPPAGVSDHATGGTRSGSLPSQDVRPPPRQTRLAFPGLAGPCRLLGMRRARLPDLCRGRAAAGVCAFCSRRGASDALACMQVRADRRLQHRQPGELERQRQQARPRVPLRVLC